MPEGKAGVLKEEKINLCYKESPKSKEVKTLLLRRITYRDDKGRLYVFITNNMVLTDQDIADIYKQRWQIELLFYAKKKIMQSGIINGANNQLVNLFTLQYRFA